MNSSIKATYLFRIIVYPLLPHSLSCPNTYASSGLGRYNTPSWRHWSSYCGLRERRREAPTTLEGMGNIEYKKKRGNCVKNKERKTDKLSKPQ